jgi:hypothetical protein
VLRRLEAAARRLRRYVLKDALQVVLGSSLFALACNGSTQPPGPPAAVVKTAGDAQAGYFNTALPIPYSVTVFDANNREVPGVSVNWAIVTGGGTLSSNPSTTNANGLASTTHTLSSATVYVVTATVNGVSPVTFSATATAHPATVGDGRGR